jgi:hypothetical protein
MKRYWVILLSVTVIGFAIPGIIIYKGLSHYKRTQLYYLNTSKMIEAGSGIVDSVTGPAISAIYPCDKTGSNNDAIPWADLYFCNSFTKADSLKGDTLEILLDIHVKPDLDGIGHPDNYWTGLKEGKKFRECKVLIPRDSISKLQKYRYKYADVTLITDDGLK